MDEFVRCPQCDDDIDGEDWEQHLGTHGYFLRSERVDQTSKQNFQEDTVLCTLSDPNLVLHFRHKDCAREAPHQWDECGVVHPALADGATKDGGGVLGARTVERSVEPGTHGGASTDRAARPLGPEPTEEMVRQERLGKAIHCAALAVQVDADKSTSVAARRRSCYGDRVWSDVTVTLALREGPHGTILEVADGGVTGHESFYLARTAWAGKHVPRDWIACAGTVGRWDTLVILAEEMDRALVALGVGS